MSLGAIQRRTKRAKAKQRAASERSGVRPNWKKALFEAHIDRLSNSFEATVCPKKSPNIRNPVVNANKYLKRCGYGKGKTPTSAVRKALHSMAKNIK